MQHEENEDTGSPDIDIAGYLQKKSKMGIYSNRFFATSGHFVSYWREEKNHQDNHDPNETYDISEIKTIKKDGNKFTLFFMNSKFKLDLRGTDEKNCKEWTELLLAKKALYSIDELLKEIGDEKIQFRTKTFKTLLTLKEKDQHKLILDRLDDMFAAAEHETTSKADTCSLINAAKGAIEELLSTCDECVAEMECRHPKVIAHCR